MTRHDLSDTLRQERLDLGWVLRDCKHGIMVLRFAAGVLIWEPAFVNGRFAGDRWCRYLVLYQVISEIPELFVLTIVILGQACRHWSQTTDPASVTESVLPSPLEQQVSGDEPVEIPSYLSMIILPKELPTSLARCTSS